MPTPRERLRVSLVRVGFSLMNKEPQVAQDARRGSKVRVVRRFARSVVRASTLVPLIQLLAQIGQIMLGRCRCSRTALSSRS